MPDVIWGFHLLTCLPNLGIVSIAGNVDKNLCEVKTCDLVAVGKNVKSYVEDLIASYKPDMVGFSCMTFQYPSALTLAKLVKSIDEDLLVVFGGYHPTLAYDEIASDGEAKPYIDFIVRGEGEATFNELIEAIQGKRSIENVEGLSYKHNGEFKHNKPRKPLDPNQIKLPDRASRIVKDCFHIFGRKADVSETSRGCTLNCSFCCITQMYGRTFRKFTIKRILEDIESVRKTGAKSLLFVDDNITLDVERLEKICEAIVEYGYDDMHYFVQASVSGIASKEELSKKMAKAGFKGVFLGIEAVSEKDIQTLNIKTKKKSIETVEKAEQYLKENDIIVLGSFILGNPEDEEKDFWNALETAKKLQLDIPVFYLVTPYPKTRLREELAGQGLIVNLNEYSKYDCFHPNTKTKSLTSDQVSFLHWKICEKWFDNLKWLKYNKIKKHYPTYHIKMVTKTWPKHLWKNLQTTFKIKNEKELYMEDIGNRKAVYSTLKNIV